jgi:hypothetical protein
MIFHRIIRSNSPSPQDFTSAAARGFGLNLPPDLQRLQTGVSVYRTLRQAAAKARHYPALGSFVAIIEIPPESAVRFERTTQQRGHFTLWGDPEDLLNSVVAVVPISEIR